MGDWGDNTDDSVRKFLFQENFNEYYLLGDNFYPSGISSLEDEQWEKKFKYLFPSKQKKYACLGNHDYLGNIFSQIEMTFQMNNHNWNMPYFYYDIIDKENSLHTLFIDTQIFSPEITTMLLVSCDIPQEKQQTYYALVYHLQEKQLEWLEKTLRDSPSKWKIICGHYPLVSNGPHIISKEFYKKVYPLLKKYKVDYYFSGHEHNCQIIKKEGIEFIISGGIYSNNSYKIDKIIEPTLFHSSLKGVFYFELKNKKMEIYFYNFLKKKSELCSIKIKI
jgi:3',5'-cyclic AMP phosphodiesterase CpdA